MLEWSAEIPGSLSASVYQGRLTARYPPQRALSLPTSAHHCWSCPAGGTSPQLTALAPCPIPGPLDTISRVSNPAIDDHTPLCFLLCGDDLEPGVALSYMLYPEVIHLGTGVEAPGKEIWRLQGWELLCHHLPQSMGQWAGGGCVSWQLGGSARSKKQQFLPCHGQKIKGGDP